MAISGTFQPLEGFMPMPPKDKGAPSPIKKPATKKAATPRKAKPKAEPAPDIQISPVDELIASMDPRHVAFVEQYLVEMNGTKAYRHAYGSPEMSEPVASACASRLLATAKAQTLLAYRVKAMFERTEDLQDRILRTLWMEAFADMTEISQLRHDCCRYCHGEGNQYQFTPKEWREHEQRYKQACAEAEAEGKPVPEFDPHGGEGFNGMAEPNPDCPECFGEGIERPWFADSRNLSPAAKAMYLNVERTKDGLKINHRDPEKSRELLMKYLKMYEEKADVIIGVIPQDQLDDLYARAGAEAAAGREEAEKRRQAREQMRREGGQ